MSTPGTLEFGGLVFDGTAASGPTGWFLGDLTGWYDAPSSKSGPDSRPQAHGSFGVAVNYRGSRVVSVEGSYAGGSMADAEVARQQLAALQADGSPATFKYTEPSLGSRTLNGAVLVNGPTIPARLFSPFFTFAFDVLAPDPKKYGDEVTNSTGLPVPGTGITYPITYPLAYGTPGADGRVTIRNTGTTESYPTFEVSGALVGGFSLVEVGTGRQIRFVRDIPDGSKVVINSRTGRAYIDVPANDVSAFLTVTDWWAVPAGGSSVVQFSALGSSSGTPTLLARLAPAFW
jgi:hypothetical protein